MTKRSQGLLAINRMGKHEAKKHHHIDTIHVVVIKELLRTG